MFIELHLIQSFAPANLNRDDTGSPKDALFGGHRRARISSQAFKAAIRREPIFAEKTGVPVGQRTKRMATPIKERLISSGKDSQLSESVALAFAGAYVTKKKDRNKGINTYLNSIDGEKTSVLTFISEEEFDLVTQLLIEDWEGVVSEVTQNGPKVLGKLVTVLINKTKGRTSAPDVALYGRMLASDPTTNIDAACQVAHALSTHSVRMEMDYYTAMDHLKPDDTAGADMVGFTNFNSACYYRYLRIDWRQLVDNLKDTALARRTVEGFLRSTMTAIPTGKQNAFAAQNCTNFAMAVARKDGKCWNLVNAFEIPVTARDKNGNNTGYIAPSIRALDDYWRDLTGFYDDSQPETVAVHVMNKHQDALNHLADYRKDKFSEWVNTIIKALPQE